MASLELRGFRTDHGHLLLTVVHAAPSLHIHNVRPASTSTPRLLERDLVDLMSWDRQLRSNNTSCQRLPIKRLRKLTTRDWVRGDCAAGWRVELLKNVRMCDAWLNLAFAQLSAPQQQEFIDDGLYAIAKAKHTTASAGDKHARDLQQYFSSKELVDQTVELVMEHLQMEQRDVVWLEPSCGDGRFLTALLREGGQYVIGYEVDERLQRIAEKNAQQAASDIALTDGSKTHVQVYAGDFLTSKSLIPIEKVVVAIGNPPFGTKGDDKSDLVHRFIHHSAREWRARIIAFIVPKRCSRPEFVETTLQLLQGDDNNETIWSVVKVPPLNDYQFEFNASDQFKRVRQPSVLQLFVCRDQ